jgi:uncharacterized protein YfaP (DUF2135 family)
LQFRLSWGSGNDLDLSVEEPSGLRIWFNDVRPRVGTQLDADVQQGPGTETITISALGPGRHAVVVTNYRGALPTPFELSVSLNGNLRRVYSGQLVEMDRPYRLSLDVE